MPKKICMHMLDYSNALNKTCLYIYELFDRDTRICRSAGRTKLCFFLCVCSFHLSLRPLWKIATAADAENYITTYEYVAHIA